MEEGLIALLFSFLLPGKEEGGVVAALNGVKDTLLGLGAETGDGRMLLPVLAGSGALASIEINPDRLDLSADYDVVAAGADDGHGLKGKVEDGKGDFVVAPVDGVAVTNDVLRLGDASLSSSLMMADALG